MNKKNHKLESLELLESTDSGYPELEQDYNSNKNYFGFLVLLVNGKYQQLNDLLMENPHQVDTVKCKALFLLNLILNKQKIVPMHISIRKARPELIDDVSYEMIELYKDLRNLIEFPEIDFYQQIEVLPNLAIYFSDYLLNEVSLHAEHSEAWQSRLEEIISNDENFVKLIDDNLRAQQYRLRAQYYRRLDQMDKAETELVKYRKNFNPSPDYTLDKLATTKAFPSAAILDNLATIYKEVAEVQEEVLLRSGIYQDTCFYYQCSDCCKKDFPSVSLTEFLFIKNSLSDDELVRFKTRAAKIQEAHVKEHGEPLKIVDQITSAKENPHEMKFTCPFLDEHDSCEIHTLRPLACRSFGLATINNKDVQACKLYLKQYQANSSHRGERPVYDSRETTAMIGGSNTRLAQEHGFKEMKQPVGTLVAWLTNS
ncbi:MAG: YkgJ family cysteine cluster protein [Cyanobacteria bacterium]|nr:YkgJ family cysteine cluster protein [Cyanobacteriota bacterium]